MYNKYLTEPELWDSTKQYKHIAIPEALPIGMNLVSVPTVTYQGVTYYAFSKTPTKGVTPNTLSAGWKPIAAGGSGAGNIDSINGSSAPNQILESNDSSVLIKTDMNTGVTDFSVENSLNSKYDKTGGTISGDVHVNRSQVGATVALFVENTDNTDSGSGSQTKITTAGANAGNPYTTFTTYGVADWSTGFNNQTKKYEIARANILGTNTTLSIDSNGNIDVPAGTLSVSRNPQTAKEVATKAYVDSFLKSIGAINQIKISSNVTLTEVSSYIVITPDANGYKVRLPLLADINTQIAMGSEFYILNLDLSDNNYSIDICYNDGTLLVTLDSLAGGNFVLNDLTENSGIQLVPKILFPLGENGPITGIQRIKTIDVKDDSTYNKHLLSNEGLDYLYNTPPVGSIAVKGGNGWEILGSGNEGQILQSNGSGQLPTFVDAAIPLMVINPFTPTDESGANLVFTAIKANYTTFGKMVFATLIFKVPTTSSTLTAKIGGFPSAFNNTVAPQLGGCLVNSGTISGDYIFSGIPGQKSGNIIIQGAPAKNNEVSEAVITITIQYLTN